MDRGIAEDCPPLRATVFDAGRALLDNRRADVFKFMREEAQNAFVRRVMDNLPFVEIVVRVSAGKATIQRLKVLRANNDSPRRPLHCGPRCMASMSPREISVADITPATGEAPASTTEVLGGPWSPSYAAYRSLVAEVQSLKSSVKDMEMMLKSLHTE